MRDIYVIPGPRRTRRPCEPPSSRWETVLCGRSCSPLPSPSAPRTPSVCRPSWDSRWWSALRTSWIHGRRLFKMLANQRRVLPGLILHLGLEHLDKVGLDAGSLRPHLKIKILSVKSGSGHLRLLQLEDVGDVLLDCRRWGGGQGHDWHPGESESLFQYAPLLLVVWHLFGHQKFYFRASWGVCHP